jgi:hypothetical protein
MSERNQLQVTPEGVVAQNWPVTIGRESRNYTDPGLWQATKGDFVYCREQESFGVLDEIGRSAYGEMILKVLFINRNSCSSPSAWFHPADLDKAFCGGPPNFNGRA